MIDWSEVGYADQMLGPIHYVGAIANIPDKRLE